MAAINFGRFQYKETIIHQMDPRLKLVSLIVLTTSTSIASDLLSYFILFCIGFLLIIVAKTPFFQLFCQLKLLGLILVVAFFFAGIGYTFSLILMILFSCVFINSTSISTIRDTLFWFLKKIPFVPAFDIAMMISLVFLFLGKIIENYNNIKDAQVSRCVNLSKNPIRRVKVLIIPLMKKSLELTNLVIESMESRGYSHIQTEPLFSTNSKSWFMFIICVAIFLIVI